MKYSKFNVRVIFVLSGFLLITLTYILKIWDLELLSDIIKDFAVVLLSIVLVEYIWDKFGNNDFNKSQLKKFGIFNVYSCPEEAESDNSWIELIKNANERIDLQALTLSFLARNNEVIQMIRKKIINGVKVRVIIMSPDHPHISESVTNENFLFPDEIRSSSNTTIKIFAKLENEIKKVKKIKGQFSFFVEKERPISISIRRFDDKLFVLPYIWNRDTVNTPVYLIKGEDNKLFKIYIGSFEEQFKKLQNHK